MQGGGEIGGGNIGAAQIKIGGAAIVGAVANENDPQFAIGSRDFVGDDGQQLLTVLLPGIFGFANDKRLKGAFFGGSLP